VTITYQRLLPDATKLGRAVLLQSGAPVASEIPADLAARVPLFTFYRFGGAAIHPVLFDRATCQCIAWGSTYELARDLAETGRVLFWQAWRSGFSTADGWLNRVDEVVAPAETRTQGQPDNVFRFDATYALFARPTP
jgi:hypothetical protein